MDHRVWIIFTLISAFSGLSFGYSSSANHANFTVDNCIRAQFDLTVTLPLSVNKSVVVTTENPDVKAAVDVDKSSCNYGTNMQRLTINWTDTASNDTSVKLYRVFSVEFTVMNDTAKPSYGVHNVQGEFQLAQFEWKRNKTAKPENITSFVTFNSGDVDKSMNGLRVPVNQSWNCQLADQLLTADKVETRLHFNFSGSPASGYQMDSAIIAASGITLDAFRPNNTDPDKYQPSLDCQKQPFDIVPIVVGLLLISTVIFVLAAYCLGSRNGRSRRRGYESV